MAHKFESTINSELFMADPVPGRISSESSNVFVKGDSDTYDHVGGEEDVFIIDSENGSFQLHRQTLKDTLQELKTQSDVSIRDLSPQYTESFRSVIEALRLLYGSQSLYDLVLNDIREIFGDVTNVKPGTVAASFVGCFNDDKFPGPMGCSPKCAAALPPTEGTPGYYNCDDLVLIHSDGLFSSLNEKSSPHAYIYIGENDFSGFSHENVQQLREAGIEDASLIFGNPDGTYREITDTLNLDQLPVDETKPDVVSTDSTDEDTSNATGAVVFTVILVAIIVLLLIAVYQRFN